MSLHRTCRLEACEREGINKFFERYTVLQCLRCENGKAIKKTFERSAFFVHIDKYLAERTVFVLARADVHLVVAELFCAYLLRAPTGFRA